MSGSCPLGDLPLHGVVGRETKVCQLDGYDIVLIGRGVNENVIALDVSVKNVAFVHLVHCLKQLPRDYFHLVFLQNSLLLLVSLNQKVE